MGKRKNEIMRKRVNGRMGGRENGNMGECPVRRSTHSCEQKPRGQALTRDRRMKEIAIVERHGKP